jgi:hypothetical protein
MGLTKRKLFALLTLMLLSMGVFTVTAYASVGETRETLSVNAAWVEGELLRINVTDIYGNTSALAMHLADYMHGTENKEFISIQAVDLMGNMSGVIQIRNPFFDPNTAPALTITVPNAPSTESAIPDSNQSTDNMRPLTPDGTGSVVDNVHDSDGIEFFTIGTEDGNVFYLIIDRQRNTDNVYLLNAVTEEDLISLAQAGGREVTPSGANNSVSAIPTPEQPGLSNDQNQQPSETPEPSEQEPDPPATPASSNDYSMLIIIGIAVLAVGGAGYYFKIARPKQNSVYDDDEDEDNYGYEDESDDDGYSDDEDEDGDER